MPQPAYKIRIPAHVRARVAAICCQHSPHGSVVAEIIVASAERELNAAFAAALAKPPQVGFIERDVPLLPQDAA